MSTSLIKLKSEHKNSDEGSREATVAARALVMIFSSFAKKRTARDVIGQNDITWKMIKNFRTL